MKGRRNISSGSSFEKEFAYSRAVISGDWIFVSGTTGYDYSTMTIPEDAASQLRNALQTIERTLKEAGSSMAHVTQVRYIVPNREDIEPCAPVVREIFGDIRPASTLIIAQLLKPEMKIEIEVTARLPDRPREM